MVPQVPRGASEAVVKAAYMRLQKKYHPDNSQVGCRHLSVDASGFLMPVRV